MSQSDPCRAPTRQAGNRDADGTESEEPTVDGEELLALLSDEHTRQVLRELSKEALAASQLAERLDSSRATVYRRLDRLESAGAVESSMSVHAQGHHRKRFRLVVERAILGFGPDGITVETDG